MAGELVSLHMGVCSAGGACGCTLLGESRYTLLGTVTVQRHALKSVALCLARWRCAIVSIGRWRTHPHVRGASVHWAASCLVDQQRYDAGSLVGGGYDSGTYLCL